MGLLLIFCSISSFLTIGIFGLVQNFILLSNGAFGLVQNLFLVKNLFLTNFISLTRVLSKSTFFSFLFSFRHSLACESWFFDSDFFCQPFCSRGGDRPSRVPVSMPQSSYLITSRPFTLFSSIGRVQRLFFVVCIGLFTVVGPVSSDRVTPFTRSHSFSGEFVVPVPVDQELCICYSPGCVILPDASTCFVVLVPSWAAHPLSLSPPWILH